MKKCKCKESVYQIGLRWESFIGSREYPDYEAHRNRVQDVRMINVWLEYFCSKCAKVFKTKDIVVDGVCKLYEEEMKYLMKLKYWKYPKEVEQ